MLVGENTKVTGNYQSPAVICWPMMVIFVHKPEPTQMHDKMVLF